MLFSNSTSYILSPSLPVQYLNGTEGGLSFGASIYKYIAQAAYDSSASGSRRRLLGLDLAAKLSSSTETSSLITAAASDPAVPQNDQMSSSIKSTAQLSALLSKQISDVAASGASLSSMLTSIGKLTKAAAAFQTSITKDGAAAPSADALQASAKSQTIDAASLTAVLAGANTAASAAAALQAVTASLNIRANNAAAFWTDSVKLNVSSLISIAYLALCSDKGASLFTYLNVSSASARRLLAGSSVTSATAGFTNGDDISAAQYPGSSFFTALGSSLASVGLEGVIISSPPKFNTSFILTFGGTITSAIAANASFRSDVTSYLLIWTPLFMTPTVMLGTASRRRSLLAGVQLPASIGGFVSQAAAAAYKESLSSANFTVRLGRPSAIVTRPSPPFASDIV